MSCTVFDVETTGLPGKGLNWKTDFMHFPRIVSIAWKNSDNDEVNYFIIKPDGWTIPEESTKIHGITNEIAHDKGVYLSIVLPAFIKDCLNSEIVIGHNVYFDTSIVKSEVMRIGNEKSFTEVLQALDKSKRIDTMMKTIKFCGIKQSGSNRLKFPSLIELHTKLFGTSFNAHNAKDDVIATDRCYLRLVKLGII